MFLLTLFGTSISNGKILMLSLHPADDVIIAAGITYKATERGGKIIYMTNGDCSGIGSGYIRQAEAVAAQVYLGEPEDNLIFLGFSDGCLIILTTKLP